MEIPRRCFVTAIRLAEGPEGTSDSVTAKDLRQMIELRPPSIMPQGNVGTPTKYFIEQIRLCRLPASLIPKLGLKSTRRRRKYDSVEFHYSTEDSAEYDEEGLVETLDKSCSEDLLRRSITEKSLQEAQSIHEQPIPTEPTERYVYAHHGPDNDSGPDDDDDQCEEWERHEALHDDVTEQDRAKPRKYEEEMEVTWEKEARDWFGSPIKTTGMNGRKELIATGHGRTTGTLTTRCTTKVSRLEQRMLATQWK